jgi:hypothetical protein
MNETSPHILEVSGRGEKKKSQLNFSSRFLTQKELDPDFVDFNSVNRRYHFPARFYLPLRGMFGQLDPLVRRLLARVAPYAYVAASPTSSPDPTGEQAESDPFLGTGRPPTPKERADCEANCKFDAPSLDKLPSRVPCDVKNSKGESGRIGIHNIGLQWPAQCGPVVRMEIGWIVFDRCTDKTKTQYTSFTRFLSTKAYAGKTFPANFPPGRTPALDLDCCGCDEIFVQVFLYSEWCSASNRAILVIEVYPP